MSARRLRIALRQFFHHSRLAQIGLILGLWFAGVQIAKALHLPLPGGIVGMALALGLLMCRSVSLFSLKRGADWFLAEMLLFFVPAVLGVLEHPEFLGLLGVKILAVILLSTIAVMAATALTVDVIFHWSEKRERLAS
jgi:holin-like protein